MSLQRGIRLLKQNIIEIQSFYTDGPVALNFIPTDVNDGDKASLLDYGQALAILEAAEKVCKDDWEYAQLILSFQLENKHPIMVFLAALLKSLPDDKD